MRERQNPGQTPAPFPVPSPWNRQQFHDLRPPLLRSSRSPEQEVIPGLLGRVWGFGDSRCHCQLGPAPHPIPAPSPFPVGKAGAALARPYLSQPLAREQPRGHSVPGAPRCPLSRPLGHKSRAARFPRCPNAIAGIGETSIPVTSELREAPGEGATIQGRERGRALGAAQGQHGVSQPPAEGDRARPGAVPTHGALVLTTRIPEPAFSRGSGGRGPESSTDCAVGKRQSCP